MIHDAVRSWARSSPHDLALVFAGRTHTVGDLVDLIDETAAACAARSAPGDRIAVHGANCAEYVALLYAIPAAGRTLVPLNTRLAPTELRSLLERSATTLLIGDPVEGWEGPHLRFEELAAAGAPDTATDPRPAASGVADHAPPAWIIFTSGTTGPPKGVRLTHAGLEAAIQTTSVGRPLADDDVYLYAFPLFHVSAYNVLHAHARRRPVVLLPRFDAAEVAAHLTRHGVTSMSLAPTMLRMLLDEVADAGLDPSTWPLRTIAYGAAPLSEALLREGTAILDCGFAQGYGMTELSGNAVFLSPADHRRGLAGEMRFLRAAGYPGPGVALRLVDDAGAAVSPGTPGEITVRGDQVCDGYLDDPEATASAIVDGWLHTGDVGVLDDDGLLHVVDRVKDLVVTGGENVSSREVEDALLGHPEVAQVAVVGLPDERWGEAVTVVVVPASETASSADLLADLRAHVAPTLAGYKRPRRIEVVDALPVNAGGKVDKRALRDRFR